MGASDEVAYQRSALLIAGLSDFYAYYPDLRGFICNVLVHPISPHYRWRYWSILGTSLIIFVTRFWWRLASRLTHSTPFYDLIQTALSSPHKVTLGQFYRRSGVFLGIALYRVVIGIAEQLLWRSHYVAISLAYRNE